RRSYDPPPAGAARARPAPPLAHYPGFHVRLRPKSQLFPHRRDSRRVPAQLAATRLGGMEPAASLGPAVRVRRSAVCCYRGADCGAAAGAPERLAVVLAVRCRLTAGV